MKLNHKKTSITSQINCPVGQNTLITQKKKISTMGYLCIFFDKKIFKKKYTTANREAKK